MEAALQERQSSPTGCRTPVNVHGHRCSSMLVPFDWEETPGTPKYLHRLETVAPYFKDDGKDAHVEFDFNKDAHVEFDFNKDAHVEFDFKLGRQSALTAADELFDKGRIKPLKLPPRLEVVHIGCGAGTVSRRWAKSASPLFRSPRQRDKEEEFDPFKRAIEETISRSRTKGDDCAFEANLATVNSSNNKKKRHWKDFLTFKATPTNRHTGRDRLGKDVGSRTPSSVSLLSSKVVVEEERFSSLRFTYEHGPSHKLASITTKELVWGSYRMVASEELARRPMAQYRRSLLRRLDPRPAIENVLRKVLGS